MDIDDLFTVHGHEHGYQSQSPRPSPLGDTDLRSHEGLMKRANICAGKVTKTVINESASVLSSGKSNNNKKESPSEKGPAPSTPQQQHTYTAQSQSNDMPNTYKTKYEDLLIFIQGSLLVGTGDDNSDMNVNMDGNETSTQHSSNSRSRTRPRYPPCMTLQGESTVNTISTTNNTSPSAYP